MTINEESGWRHGEGWGWRWGPDDEIGALNTLSPASRLAALGTISQGKVYDLGVDIDRKSYLAAAHVGTQVVAYRTAEGMLRQDLAELGQPDGVSFNTSMIVVSDHAGTQIDGLCHATFGQDRHWYNGYTAQQHGSDFGPTKAAAHLIPPIIVEACLIDLPAVQGVDELAPGHAITVEELQEALAAQGTELRVGGAVFIRTGAMRHWGVDGSNHASISGPDTAGLSLASARWLVEEKGAVLIGADNSTVECVPPVDGDNLAPVHKYLLVDQGVHMGELHFLEQLSADRVYQFCYVALCPKMRGATAGFALRPIGIV